MPLKMPHARMIKKLTLLCAQNPKMLLLADTLGALLSALLLWALIQDFSPATGMPQSALSLLLTAAGCLLLYSGACFLLVKEKWAFFIRTLSAANCFYCLLALLMLIIHHKNLTFFGAVYFSGETALILALAWIELGTARIISKPRP
jgi:O-antigen/teichoic acid export membrane protein